MDATLQAAASRAERLAADIVMNKRKLLDLDKRRAENREALASFRDKRRRTSSSTTTPLAKSWMNLGTIFVKVPDGDIEAMLLRDQQTIDKELDDTRSEMKLQMKELQLLRPSALDSKLIALALRDSPAESAGTVSANSRIQVHSVDLDD